jgi:glycosyltransferase involved in cell wall biosynthesis
VHRLTEPSGQPAVIWPERRLKILIWHVHGSYLAGLSALDHDWYLPVSADYGGRRVDSPAYVREVPAAQVRHLDLDLVIYQTPKNFYEDGPAILTPAQQRLPKLYLEHNVPRPHPVETRHPIDDPGVLLVHVTHYNRLLWDNGRTPTIVIEHSVNIDRSVTYSGELQRGITVINSMARRGRAVGYDLFLEVRRTLPLDVAGIDSEAFGGLGDIKYSQLHRCMAAYRFLFSPIRYTSLPLAVIEALTIGMPVVALATTEIPTVLQNGVHGYISCDVDDLVAGMRRLLADPDEARQLGANARELARTRFGLERFVRDWNRAFALVLHGGR